MGASFIAWLLSGTNVNPLPAHYYCPVGKKVEFCSEEKWGIDLPDKMCACGNNYHKDSCREDVYAYVYAKLNGKCCENPSGQVFEIKEAVRKGKYSNNWFQYAEAACSWAVRDRGP